MGNIVKNTVLLNPEYTSSSESPNFRTVLEAVAWAKTNCPSFIHADRYEDEFGNRMYYFVFEQDSDMAWFALKWG